jgi:hypothetical protein
MGRHLFHLLFFSGLVSVFFATLAGSDRRSRLKIGGWLFGGMVLLSVLLAWIMYAFVH